MDTDPQPVQGNQQNISGSVTGPVVGGNVGQIGNTTFNQNIITNPQPIDDATLTAATAKHAQLPTDIIPLISQALPLGSRPVYSVNPLFVGREKEMLTLANHLKNGGSTVAIVGLGGIGKTQLAVAFVHHYGQYFPGGVHWLSFADPNGVTSEIAACGYTMPYLRADYPTLDVANQVRLVLAAWQNPLPRLLVFDNCEDQVLMDQWRPPTGGSRVLITSRRPNWAAALGVAVVPLEKLTRGQSVKLLCKFRSDLPSSDTFLNQIADELGDLPLALHLAGSYLDNLRYNVGSYD